jgi:hypothetical protein
MASTESLWSLNQQGKMLRSIGVDNEGGKIFWMDNFKQLSQPMINFGVSACLDTLGTQMNLAKWYPSTQPSKTCKRCNRSNQTLGHILANCCIEMNLQGEIHNRVTWRHNSILRVIVNAFLSSGLDNKYTIACDLPDMRSNVCLPEDIQGAINLQRPDLILLSRLPHGNGKRDIWIIELTSCMEENILQWNNLKGARYSALARRLSESYNVENRPIEIGCRGYVANSFIELLKDIKLTKQQEKTLCNQVSRVALECSSRIFKNRNTHNLLSEN